MSIKSVITTVLLLVAAAGLVAVFWPADEEPREPAAAAIAMTDDGLPVDGVAVYYFHGYKRCFTCNKMEALADQAIHDRFGDLVDSGRVVFQAVNIETDEHRHFVADYELVNKVVVVSERRDGQEANWTRLDLVWEKIGDDDEYRAYITENVAAALARVGVEAD